MSAISSVGSSTAALSQLTSSLVEQAVLEICDSGSESGEKIELQ